MQSDVEVKRSNGYGKGGRLIAFVRPIYYCFNRSRKVSADTGAELREKIEKTIQKWYAPVVIRYEINGNTVCSNSKDNALTEYWRVCNKEDIGKIFEVTQLRDLK